MLELCPMEGSSCDPSVMEGEEQAIIQEEMCDCNIC